MKTRIITGIMIVALVALSAGVAAAQYGQGGSTGDVQYVDADGDGICDNIGERPGFVDADGDGIPNGQDDDYEPLRDGNGRGNGGQGKGRNL